MDDLLEAALATVPYPHPATAALPTRRAPSPFATPPRMLLRQNKAKSRIRWGLRRSIKEWMDRIVKSCRRHKWRNSCQLAKDLQCSADQALSLMKVPDERLILVEKVGWRNGSLDGFQFLIGLKGEPIPEGYVIVEDERQADDLVKYLTSQMQWATTTDIARQFELDFNKARKMMMAIKDQRLVLTRKTRKSGAAYSLLGLREWNVPDGYTIYNGEEEDEVEEAAGRERRLNRSRKELMDRIVETCRRHKWRNSRQLEQDLQCSVYRASSLIKVPDERLILVKKVGWRNGYDGFQYLKGLKGEPIPEGYVIVENEDGQQTDDLVVVNYLTQQKKWASTTDVARYFKLDFHMAKKMMMAIKDERLVLTRKTLKSGAVLFLLGLRVWKVPDGYTIYNGEEKEEEEAANRERRLNRSIEEWMDRIVKSCRLHKWCNGRQLANDLHCSVDRASSFMKVPDERLILVEKVGWRRGMRDELQFLLGLKGEPMPEGYVIVENEEDLGQQADDLVNYLTSQMQWASTTDIARHFKLSFNKAKAMMTIKDERLVSTRKRFESGTVYFLLGLREWKVEDGYEICNREEEEEKEEEDEEEDQHEKEAAAAEVMEEPPRKRLKAETPDALENAALHAAQAIKEALKRMAGHD